MSRESTNLFDLDQPLDESLILMSFRDQLIKGAISVNREFSGLDHLIDQAIKEETLGGVLEALFGTRR